MAKHYTSNSSDTPRLFRSNFLEKFTKVHFSIPLYVFLPIIAVCIYHALTLNSDPLYFLLYLGLGLVFWSFTEYILHRFVFHFTPKNKWQDEIHFIFHGVHHDFPKDRLRLVLPPSVSIPLATLFFFIFKAIIPSESVLYTFFPGFLLGYLYYDMMHYAMHHYTFRNAYMSKVQQHHMLHHYQDEYKDFGVTSDLWDRIFRSESEIQKKAKKAA